jgi:hypothetical protein
MSNKWDSLKEITKAMITTMASYDSTGVKSWDARIAIQDLAYQAGGLLKLDMQLHNERHLQGKTTDQIKSDIEMELAEVIADALFAAHKLGLDVRNGFQRMLDSDKEKIAERTRK